MADISAATVTDAFVKCWVSRFGVPAFIICDRGTQFTSSTFTSLVNTLGSRVSFTTSFHPQSNGLLERQHRRLKDSLRAADADWTSQLPWTLLGMRSTPHEDSGVSSAELLFGQPLCLPGTLLDYPETAPEQLRRKFLDLQAGLPVREQPPRLLPPVPSMSFAYLREDKAKPPLADRYSGPYRVCRQLRNTIVLQRGDRQEKVSLARVKPYRGREPPEVAQPPRRGRPPRARTGGDPCGD